MASESVHIFGIRHHGPGSARSLAAALAALRPDCILIEGPPDAQDVLPLAAHADIRPPVALLVYDPKAPARAAFYPFAEFSPEWQAIRFGLARQTPVRFMDLPQAHRLAAPEDQDADAAVPADEDEQLALLREDPLSLLAQASGHEDGERWWEHMVETRADSTDLFAAIAEAMTALRQDAAPPLDRWEALREAHMRKTLRAAASEGFGRIAVVCGAWHLPALQEMPAAKADNDLLKGLPRTAVAATWVPWTYGRLSRASGYGAGVQSPGWYQHLWDAAAAGADPGDSAIGWLTRVARALRGEDMDCSSAHVIEAARLAESLAALRGRPVPGLGEFNEAVRTVFLFGSDLPMALIRERLIVGERLGGVPEDTPAVPLQRDLAGLQKSLRLPPQAVEKPLDLDLRKPNDLARSHLLHRLLVLGIGWGQRQETTGRKAGTFHENWLLQWEPQFAVAVIEASVWGNTIEEAANARAADRAMRAEELAELTELLDAVLLADLAAAAGTVAGRLDHLAAVATDVGHLMDALPALARILRYGNVRQTDAEMVGRLVDGLLPRICAGLPGACSSMNDEAAAEMFERLMRVDAAVGLLADERHTADWRRLLGQLADLPAIHGLVAGRCCRLLLDGRALTGEQAGLRLSLALSTASDPAAAAAWVEGFLRGSGLVLLHDPQLWAVLDGWVADMKAGAFTAVLPLLRRTFATFAPAERRQMGQRVGRAAPSGAQSGAASDGGFDAARAAAVLPLLAKLLGAEPPQTAAPAGDQEAPA